MAERAEVGEPSAGGPARARRARWAAVVVALFAVLPTLPSLGAGLVSDDTAALAWVHAHGPFADWTTSQYDLRTVRFWRPLVTTSLALQERTTGIAPVPLRLFNLAGHVASALLVLALGLRLGLALGGALAAGILAALFPHQGGTVVWIVGRVDSLTIPLVLGALVLALDGRRAASALVAALACASKEIAFVLPALVVLFAWARADGPRAIVRATWPVLAAVALCFVWRRLAIGVWRGGYPSAGVPLSEAIDGWAHAVRWSLLVLALVVPCAAVAKTLRLRVALGAALAAVVAALPLADVRAADEHLRTILLADLCLVLALGACAGRRPARPVLAFGVPLAGVVFALLWAVAAFRAKDVLADVHAWTRAAELAESVERDVRAALADVAPSDEPVLVAFPAARDGAHVLAWGGPDRFRPPFELAPRPVWTDRPLFGPPYPERDHAGARLGPLVLDPTRRAPAALAVALLDEGAPASALRVDARVFGDDAPGAPAIELGPLVAPAPLEAIVYTDLGYDVAGLGTLPAGERVVIALRDVLLARGAPLYEALVIADDFGATEARLELRIPAADGRVAAAASPWIPLTWESGLSDLVYPK